MRRRTGKCKSVARLRLAQLAFGGWHLAQKGPGHMGVRLPVPLTGWRAEGEDALGTAGETPALQQVPGRKARIFMARC
jgi:hypothetical protein